MLVIFHDGLSVCLSEFMYVCMYVCTWFIYFRVHTFVMLESMLIVFFSTLYFLRDRVSHWIQNLSNLLDCLGSKPLGSHLCFPRTGITGIPPCLIFRGGTDVLNLVLIVLWSALSLSATPLAPRCKVLRRDILLHTWAAEVKPLWTVQILLVWLIFFFFPLFFRIAAIKF